MLGAICICALWASTASAQTPLRLETVATGLERPIYVTHAPGDFTRLFVIEKRGFIRVIENGVLLPTPFIDLDALVGGGTSDSSEQGLLGLAFHPDYQNNGYFYVNYTRTNGNTVVRRYTVSANPNIADDTTGMRVIGYQQPQTNHNGGWIEFGPDGYLYIASGDGGGAGDTGSGHTSGVGNGQDITDNLLGKILRIDVDGDDFPGDTQRNYAIPPDNPFVGVTGDDEIWAFGLRNPWRNAFDRVTGDLWIADVGQNSWEEINYQPASSAGGENYGWRCREGAHNFNTSGDCSQTPFIDPIQEYSHNAGRCSITGGYVYRGCAIPDLTGKYFYGDYCTGNVWSFRYDGVSITDFVDHTAELAPGGFALVSFGEDAYGELYICDQPGGRVYRIVPDVPGGIVGDDCNANGRDDACDLLDGSATDINGNGVLDECECVGDTDGDGDTDLTDLARLLANFDASPADPNDGDINNDDVVDLTDLALMLADFDCTTP
ncbi:MAG: hypothetical protein D6744_00520 [Planctomycetota bacterium]|nr:MAG: hypothetical protein D6744_00520 [Planctomycetota bacterium]